MIVASYRATESNPRTIEAIRRQRERERQRQIDARRQEAARTVPLSVIIAQNEDAERENKLRAEAERIAAQARQDNPPEHYTMRQAVQDFALVHGVSYQDLIGPSRERVISNVRQLGYWTIQQMFPEKSPTAIGRAFGGRDRTTIIHGMQPFGYKGSGRGPSSLVRIIDPKIMDSMRSAGKTFKEIADRFRISESTAKRHYHAFKRAHRAA